MTTEIDYAKLSKNLATAFHQFADGARKAADEWAAMLDRIPNKPPRP